MLDIVDNSMLELITGLHELPIGANNIRKNGEKAALNVNIEK